MLYELYGWKVDIKVVKYETATHRRTNWIMVHFLDQNKINNTGESAFRNLIKLHFGMRKQTCLPLTFNAEASDPLRISQSFCLSGAFD